MPLPDLSTPSSNHLFSPCFRNRAASVRATAYSFSLRLRKMSYLKPEDAMTELMAAELE
jgi:hypothetical protein